MGRLFQFPYFDVWDVVLAGCERFALGYHARGWKALRVATVVSINAWILSVLIVFPLNCCTYGFAFFSIFRKKTATAVAFAKQGRGLIKVNGQPIENIQPEALRLKVFEPVLIVGQEKFSNLDIRIRVKGGGITAQIYAIRAAIAKSVVAYHAKYVDEESKNQLRKTLLEYDRTLLVSDPRRCEPKKYGGRSARARFQKSYR